ncbi:MAG TPA: fructose-bisphosphatase class II, partial [Gaiella sp.]|nr:fructose-bisphosphatase class II [Gaiella sp.]
MTDCLCTRYARATEWAALAGARWLGRADEEAAEDAAANGMRAALDEMPIDGRVVIGARAGEALSPDGSVGAGGDRVDLALDPIEGRGVVARGGVGALAMLAVAPEGALRHLPDMYMRSIAVGPR